jgi:hypothetical protein
VFLKFAKLWELDRVRRSGFRVQGSFGFEVPGAEGPSAEPSTQNPEPRTPNGNEP